MKPFSIAVPDPVLLDLRARLRSTRWPNQLEGAGWDYGTELGYLQELCGYWHDSFDWRAQEARLNRWEQFTEEIDGENIHFLHARSREEGALPLVITHGWPGSIVEFTKVIEPLRDPAAHGGRPGDAFHVVCPSLPGYAFSGPTRSRGWSPSRVARAWASLMGRLGYPRYGAQGGDWGSVVTTQLARLDPEHVCGIHLNMVIAGQPEGFDLARLTPAEQRALADAAAFGRDGSGYMQIQSTRPQTLGYALDDSPAGLAGWIVEKFRAWSDCADASGERDVERAFTRDELLTNVTIYWVTRTASSSVRLYCEARRSEELAAPPRRTLVPTGCAIFPGEILRPPRAWAEAAYDVRRWTELPRGGHFAAMEEPELFVEDVRAFFRELR